MVYTVEILDKDRNLKARILNYAGLQYSRKLSDVGTCSLRVLTRDPLFQLEGDLTEPFKNHIRIKRFGVVVWQGVIVNNLRRTKDYVDIEGNTYLYMLSKILVRHDTSGDTNYRTVSSGTLADFVRTIMTEAIADAGGVLSGMQLGAIDNPDFPAGFVDSTGAALTGTWTFSTNFQLKYDYRDILYIIRSLAIYAIFDFELDDDLNFTFQAFVGNKQPGLVFSYGSLGNIFDFNLPRDGGNMVNDLVGVAADNDYNILTVEKTDPDSIASYGKLQSVAAYADVKDTNLLTQRLREDLTLNSTPDAESQISPKTDAYPLGQYGIGDIVTIKIKDGVIDYDQQRRIVQINVIVKDTGEEIITLITNKPRPTQ